MSPKNLQKQSTINGLMVPSIQFCRFVIYLFFIAVVLNARLDNAVKRLTTVRIIASRVQDLSAS
jgi:hypothetical protein